jgi:hypothetical protein
MKCGPTVFVQGYLRLMSVLSPALQQDVCDIQGWSLQQDSEEVRTSWWLPVEWLVLGGQILDLSTLDQGSSAPVSVY